ncbi:MAG: ABC transporter ATP-binding protein [Deltaproteobacteria bacterium]|nr:ABC transporter ATP-binding protein [Deltaproteobacteria bacterium]MBI2501441.1 ABC transporter ATP-binding protein [Deltaproteobacteria bacterium]MBI4196661.1 ABC transporter ATP-binding protein [Deltaproteobacteria bacterium]
MSLLIEAKGIHKVYRGQALETAVLKGVDLQIARGSLTLITGASGSGKSTLLHILGSLDRPTAGKIYLNERDLYEEGDEALAQLRNQEIGFVFQAYHLLPDMTALENVMIPLLIRGRSSQESRLQSEKVLDRVGLAHRFNHRPSQLSGGEQQRVAIARAVVGSPSLLFADEPTGNLDRRSGEQVLELLLELQAKEGMALVMVTHNEEISQKFSIRYLLKDGLLGKSKG